MRPHAGFTLDRTLQGWLGQMAQDKTSGPGFLRRHFQHDTGKLIPQRHQQEHLPSIDGREQLLWISIKQKVILQNNSTLFISRPLSHTKIVVLSYYTFLISSIKIWWKCVLSPLSASIRALALPFDPQSLRFWLWSFTEVCWPPKRVWGSGKLPRGCLEWILGTRWELVP